MITIRYQGRLWHVRASEHGRPEDDDHYTLVEVMRQHDGKVWTKRYGWRSTYVDRRRGYLPDEALRRMAREVIDEIYPISEREK